MYSQFFRRFSGERSLFGFAKRQNGREVRGTSLWPL